MEMNRNRIRVWDLPTRLFHWGLVFSFALAWATADSDAWMGAHVFAGSLLLVLLTFRLLWGVVGSHYARFTEFAYGPRAVIDHLLGVLRLKPPHYVGHNPTGGYAIFALIGLGLLTALIGLLLLGVEEGHGPMAALFRRSWWDMLKELHEGAAALMLAIVALHVTGVLVESLLHRENLIGSMFHGTKLAGAQAPAVSRRWDGVVLLLAAVGLFSFLFFRPALVQSGQAMIFSGTPLAMEPAWKNECGSCHLAFHPSLLPLRSWQALLKEQHDHFGEDLGLSPTTAAKLQAFAQAESAEQMTTEAAFKTLRSLKHDNAPLQITKTPYWHKKHHEIPANVWKLPTVGGPSQCQNCHSDAEAGLFEDEGIRMPKGS